MPNTIFNGDTTNNNNGSATSPDASMQTTGSVSELVGPGKKFATVEDLARGKVEADAYIEQLKGETAGLRSDLDQRLSAEELLEQIRTEREAQLAASNQPAQGNTTPSLGTDDITSLVKATIEQREVMQTASQNLAAADKRMKELYGEKALEVMNQKASEAGVSVKFLTDIAAKSPKAFYNVLGLEQAKGSSLPNMTRGSVDPESLGSNRSSGGLSTWADFEKLRKENPKLYWKPATQTALFKAKKENGDAFGN